GITGREQVVLALAAAAPHRADGVDDVLGFQAIAAGDLGGTGVAAAERAAFGEKLRSGGAMDGTVDAAAAEQCPVGGVDDGPDIERGDVRDADFEPRRADFGGEEASGHGSMVAQSHARRSAPGFAGIAARGEVDRCEQRTRFYPPHKGEGSAPSARRVYA